MKSRLFIRLALLIFLAGMLAVVLDTLLAPGAAFALDRAAPLPTPTPSPTVAVKVGSNANLAIGAVLLVLIILFGVIVNLRRKKLPPGH